MGSFRLIRSGFPPSNYVVAIFIDLDGTLIAQAPDGKSNNLNGFIKRPWADEFLDKCSKLGKLYMFTATDCNRASRAIRALGWENRFERVLSRTNVQSGDSPPRCNSFVLVDNDEHAIRTKKEYLMSSPHSSSKCGSLIEAQNGMCELPMDDDAFGSAVKVDTYIEGEDDGLKVAYDEVCKELQDISSPETNRFFRG